MNPGVEKKKRQAPAAAGPNSTAKGDLFIVGPRAKKAGANDPESQRKENQDNMNAHLNWHADEVLEFVLTLSNPL